MLSFEQQLSSLVLLEVEKDQAVKRLREMCGYDRKALHTFQMSFHCVLICVSCKIVHPRAAVEIRVSGFSLSIPQQTCPVDFPTLLYLLNRFWW